MKQNDSSKGDVKQNDSRKGDVKQNDPHKGDKQNDSHKGAVKQNDSHKGAVKQNDSRKGDKQNDSHKGDVKQNDHLRGVQVPVKGPGGVQWQWKPPEAPGFYSIFNAKYCINLFYFNTFFLQIFQEKELLGLPPPFIKKWGSRG